MLSADSKTAVWEHKDDRPRSPPQGNKRWKAFCDEFKWNNLWHLQQEGSLEKVPRDWPNIGETFAKNLLFGLFTLLDVGSDFLAAEEFWSGGDYTKTVDTLNDTYVTGEFNCTQIGHYVNDQMEEISSYTFQCRETNRVSAVFTICFMLLPAVNFSFALASRGLSWVGLAIFAFIIPFPITLLIVKMIALVNIGEQFKSVNLMVTRAEAR